MTIQQELVQRIIRESWETSNGALNEVTLLNGIEMAEKYDGIRVSRMTDAEKQLAIYQSALKALAAATGQDMYAFLYRAAEEAHRLGIITDAEWCAMRERGQIT
ncbi:MAG: hypothetical protein ACLQVL_36790 [Terriglobia bacterium]